jgi:hypothetical protein
MAELAALLILGNPGERHRPSLRHRSADSAFVLVRMYEVPGRGRCGGVLRRRGCAGDSSAGQGESLPPSSVSANLAVVGLPDLVGSMSFFQTDGVSMAAGK